MFLQFIHDSLNLEWVLHILLLSSISFHFVSFRFDGMIDSTFSING